MIELQPGIELSVAQAGRVLAAWRDDVACTGVERLTGGMVNSVFLLRLDRPPHAAVVKLHGTEHATFAREAAALEHLGAATSCPVPRVLLHDGSAQVVPFAFLLLEHVPGACLADLDLGQGDRADVDRQLAEVLADLHEHTATGFGPLAPDEQSSSWVELFAARLAATRAMPAVAERLPAAVLARVDAAIGMVPSVLDDAAVPRLVHGDVWDGNVVVRREGGRWRLAALLDPDLQFADVEQEVAYLEAFGSDRAAFRAAYGARRELRPGYERRRPCYWLQTALLHVGLFEGHHFRAHAADAADAVLADHTA